MFCKCGSSKIENRDRGLCASCNRIWRASQTVATVKERRPLAQVSAVRGVMLKAREGAYKQVKAEHPEHCAACGTRRNLTPSHVLTQGNHQKHMADPDNIVILCRECHDMWEHHKQEFKATFPDVWERKLTIMQALEPAYYLQFKDKHGV